jgi:predicted membrane-bound mannosyltransferase
MYFSRFIREDLYSLVFTLGTIVAFQRFLETDRSKWLLLSAASFAFAGVTKENAYMTGVLFVVYGLWCLGRGAGEPGGPSPRASVDAAWRWSLARLSPLLSAGILFLVIWAGMYTAFGTYPGDWLASTRSHASLGPGTTTSRSSSSTTPPSSSPRSSRSRGATGRPTRSSA